MTSGIYKIECSATDKVYIGSAKDFHKRKNRHFYCLRKNDHRNKKLQRAFNKYGEASFSFSVVEHVSELTTIHIREKFWIDHYDSVNNGYNIAYDTIAPMLGRNHSEQTKALMSRNNARNKSNLGKKFTEEHKMKIGLSKIGKKRPDVAKRFSDLNRMNIGEKNNFFGRNHTEKSKKKISERNGIPIVQLYNNIPIKVYESATKAAIELGINNANISKCCKAPNKTAGGFKFIFIQ